MGGVAQIARQAGHLVTGCDKNVYPPMSGALKNAGIELIEGFELEQLELKPDLWVIGNAVSRGNPLLEAILNEGLPYTSGPQWMSENILQGRRVLAVAGTHGKTTTTAMLGWILKEAGLEPGFLIGGVPGWSECSADLGNASRPRAPFVIEADEYDTCFFDKRSKFMHYRPRTAILNNLEYDHADIFPNLAAIETQFHHLVRIMPSEGTIIANGRCEALDRVLERGCWSTLERFDAPYEDIGTSTGWQIDFHSAGGVVYLDGRKVGELSLLMPGKYNALNAVAAVAAARTVGVEPEAALEALARFSGVRRRQEMKGYAGGCAVIDDFAHHPTAIRETVAAVKSKMAYFAGEAGAEGAQGRLLALLEPRSNTMKLGTMKSMLAESLADADKVFCYAGAGVQWDPAEALAPLGGKAYATHDVDDLVEHAVETARPGDVLLCMSNGAFGGIHEKLLEALEKKAGK